MKQAACSLLFFAVLAGAFLAGSSYQRAHNSKAGVRRVLYYVDPMHPAYKSDRPGIAPDCGMQLEPVYADGDTAESSTSAANVPGSVRVSPEKQQLIGVRVGAVEQTGGIQKLRLFGRVTPDETRVYRLKAGIDGFIRDISNVTTGSQVRAGQWLASFSAPDTRAAIQSYLVTLDTADRAIQGGADQPAQLRQANASIQLAVDRLQNVGLSTLQIEQIKRTRTVPADLSIIAPADGFVLARNVSIGERFEKGAEWYRIADLKRVWILADVFEREARMVQPGMKARVSFPGHDQVLEARVSDILPQFDLGSRSFKVRLEAANPRFALRPDMFVDLELEIPFSPMLAVPADAVLDSGNTKTLFVDRGEGLFEPRRVETGRRFNDQVEIVKGLAPGERVAIGGNFLLDSESRLVTASAQARKSVKDLVCGMELQEAALRAAANRIGYAGKTYYFCSEQCKRKFAADPDRYLGTPVEHQRGSATHVARLP